MTPADGAGAVERGESMGDNEEVMVMLGQTKVV
jgi:hypothetical protein